MPLELRLTKINPNMSAATIECCYVQPDSLISPGDKLFDVSVDLSAGFSQYCPPISYFRVVAREKAWLRNLAVKPGDSCEVGALLMLCGTNSDDQDVAAPRALRVVMAGISHHPAMWSTGEQ